MLVPSGNWQWYIDEQTGCLAIALDKGLHCVTGLKCRYLASRCEFPAEFSVEHTEYYYDFMQSLECTGFTHAQQVHLVINAVAARCFHKPVPLKSWFYTANSHGSHSNSRVYQIYTALDQSPVMVLESDATRSLCMILDEHLTLSPEKSLAQFSLVNICNDRLFDFSSRSQGLKTA